MYDFLIIINKIDNKIKSEFEIYQELKLVPFYYFKEKMFLWNTYLWLKKIIIINLAWYLKF